METSVDDVISSCVVSDDADFNHADISRLMMDNDDYDD